MHSVLEHDAKLVLVSWCGRRNAQKCCKHKVYQQQSCTVSCNGRCQRVEMRFISDLRSSEVSGRAVEGVHRCLLSRVDGKRPANAHGHGRTATWGAAGACMGGVAWWAIHLFTAPSFGFAAASIAVCPSGTFECSPTSHAAPHSTIPWRGDSRRVDHTPNVSSCGEESSSRRAAPATSAPHAWTDSTSI